MPFLFLRRQFRVHPVHVELEPRAATVQGLHLGDLHLLRIERTVRVDIAVHGRVDELQAMEDAVMPHADALARHLAVDRGDAVEPFRPLVDVDQGLAH